MRKRILTIFIIFVLLFTSLVVRLGYITFISADKITKLANELWKRDIPVQSDRGIIYDRNGEVLAGNKLAYTVASINKQCTIIINNGINICLGIRSKVCNISDSHFNLLFYATNIRTEFCTNKCLRFIFYSFFSTHLYSNFPSSKTL